MLSACNSARYEPSVIDSGIQGLSTSLRHRRVPSMIAALWPVESTLARNLIIDTFGTARGGNVARSPRRHGNGGTPAPRLADAQAAAASALLGGSGRAGRRVDRPQRSCPGSQTRACAFCRRRCSHARVDRLGGIPGHGFRFFSAWLLDGKRLRIVDPTRGERWNRKMGGQGSRDRRRPVAATKQTIYAGLGDPRRTAHAAHADIARPPARRERSYGR